MSKVTGMFRGRPDPGRRELGRSQKARHRWIDLGGKLGQACGNCGLPKPRADQELPSCPGKIELDQRALKKRRQDSLASLMLGWSWVRMRKQLNDRIEPNMVEYNRIAAVRPFAGICIEQFNTEFQRASDEAKSIYQAVAADTCPRLHCLAVCVLILRLVELGHVDPGEQASIQATAILAEAQDEGSGWNYRPGELGELADRMWAHARKMGFWGAAITSLPN